MDGHFGELKKLPNVLNVGRSKKFVGGVQTDIDCITVFVRRKVPESELKEEEKVPKEIDGIPTDVVEQNPDYQLGETSVSRKHPSIQKRMGGGVKKQ